MDDRRRLSHRGKDQHVELGIAPDRGQITRIGGVKVPHHRPAPQHDGIEAAGRDLQRAALKEAQEESGLPALVIDDGIFDLDRHWIPEHKGVPAHWHYDVRYVVRAGADEAFVVSEESHDLAWRSIAELAAEAVADPSVRRMAGKWLGRAARAGQHAGM